MEKRTDQIDNITQRFFESFNHLSLEELNWKPGQKTWSIAQNIDHLIAINKSYFPIFENLKKGKQKLPIMANFGFFVSFFGKMILKSVHPDRKKKMKTFSLWEPGRSNLPESILDDFRHSQALLKEYIITSDELIFQNSVISSPANKNIVYRLETAFDIIITHQERHYNQALEVLEKIQLPKSAIN